jgi:tetratricopeptide (TPR) repeat protein
MVKDHHGHELTGASVAAGELYQKALTAQHCYAGDGFTAVQAAIEDSPGFVMAHALKAYMTLLGSNNETAMIGLEAFNAAKDLSANPRERGHIAAISALLQGEIRTAGRVLEDVALAHPHDVLALQIGQTMDFLLGDARMKRDRIGRVRPLWSPDMPDWHAILGLHAFGLEECGQYERAEEAGREAVSLQPRNNWAQHAVAHVLVMQGRHADGVRWMLQENTGWQPEATLGVHNWWHTALFHLGLGEVDEVLRLYDGPIYGEATTFAFDLADAAALLWRLQLMGVDVGDRWKVVADNFASEGHGRSAFVDTHAMMAYVGAGREAEQKALLEAQQQAMGGGGDNAVFVRDVGHATVSAIHAFGRGDDAKAIDLLRTVRNRAGRFGGSHAQRDVLDLTLIAAARRGGETALERALLAEREEAMPLAREAIRALAA